MLGLNLSYSLHISKNLSQIRRCLENRPGFKASSGVRMRVDPFVCVKQPCVCYKRKIDSSRISYFGFQTITLKEGIKNGRSEGAK